MISRKGNGKGTHRSYLQIMADILEAGKGGVNKTYFMARCNLSFKQLNQYLPFLLQLEFFETIVDETTKKIFYRTASRGCEFLRIYGQLGQLLTSDEPGSTAPYVISTTSQTNDISTGPYVAGVPLAVLNGKNSLNRKF